MIDMTVYETPRPMYRPEYAEEFRYIRYPLAYRAKSMHRFQTGQAPKTAYYVDDGFGNLRELQAFAVEYHNHFAQN